MYAANEIQYCYGKSSIQQEEEYFVQQFGYDINKREVKSYIWGLAAYGAQNWELRKLYQK